MAGKKIGISRDLIIHPGETIADVLEERGITQAELAARAGVSPAYVSAVIEVIRGYLPILRWAWNMHWKFPSPFG